MNMRNVALLVLVVALLPVPAIAEGGCPLGQIPYSGTPPPGSAASLATCGPIPISPPSAPQWETRWGAIASGGGFGIVTGASSERKAVKGAIAECQKRGGTSCKKLMTFRNQCAAVVSSTTESFAQAAPYEQDAVEVGKERCAESKTGDCWVYYSGCSLPVRVR